MGSLVSPALLPVFSLISSFLVLLFHHLIPITSAPYAHLSTFTSPPHQFSLYLSPVFSSSFVESGEPVSDGEEWGEVVELSLEQIFQDTHSNKLIFLRYANKVTPWTLR